MQAEELARRADGDFFLSDHGAILKEWLGLFCASAAATLEAALERMEEDPPAAKAYGAAFTHDLNTCRALAAADTYGEVYTILGGYENLKLGSLRGASPDMTAAKDARTDIYKALKKLREDYFSDTPEGLSVQMRETAAMCLVLYELLKTYDERIMSEKKRRGICDFTDNRRYLLSLLRAPDGSPTPLSHEYAARFDEVYIDEYQDVDEMQDEIFRLIGGDHRFMVGDIKQSIYVFRGADPSVFARYRRELPALDPQNPTEGRQASGNSIFMSDNFRCDESVIRITNAVCGHMLRACPQTVDYRDEDDLGFSKPAPEGYTPPPVRVTVLTKAEEDSADAPRESDAELGGVEAEAAYVAGEIATLLREGRLASGKPIRPKDIVILMRSRRALEAYRTALSRLRIPTEAAELEAVEAGRDLLHGDDMYYIVNLLRVLDNPDSDIPLSEILRAPFPGLTLEELTVLRSEGDPAAESHSLYAGCEAYLSRKDTDPVLRGKLLSFMEWLEEYRNLTATHPADAILKMLRRDPLCASRRSPAFLYVYDCARSYRTASFLSLCVFLRYFEVKLRTEKKAPVPADNSEDGHVSMMTIHNSKGLEFPVCFVVRCGQYFRHKTQSADLLFDKRAGVAMKLYRRGGEEAGGEGKRDTTLRRAAALSVRISEREEEMRLLYVAMTRARERLYLVGTGNDKPHRFTAGDRYATMESNTYLKWILAGLDAHPEVGNHAVLRYLSASELPEVEPLPVTGVIRADGEGDGVAERYRRIRENRPAVSAADGILTHIPTTVPASKMRDRLLDTCIFFETDLTEADGKLADATPDGYRVDVDSAATVRATLTLMKNSEDNEFELLLSAGRRPTASERGTATHLFLQFCDYERVLREGTDSEILRLTEMGYLTRRAADILDRDMLAGFFGSDFFAHMRTAVSVEREMKFNRFVPLSSLTESPALASLLGERTLMVRGSVDLLCTYPDGHLELCDYKTDHITPAERRDPSLLRDRMIQKHREQLVQYAAAVTEIYGTAPSKAYIFSLPLGEAIEIPL